MKFRSISPTVLVLPLLVACASPYAVTQRIDLLGDPAAPSSTTRTIVITPDTTWVKVTSGDTVKFIVGERTFAWDFNGVRVVPVFALNQIAPAGLLGREVLVYVDPDPRYSIGGDWQASPASVLCEYPRADCYRPLMAADQVRVQQLALAAGV